LKLCFKNQKDPRWLTVPPWSSTLCFEVSN
jgi:hypothetical protein